MRKLGFMLSITILALALGFGAVMPMAASPNRDPALETSSPTVTVAVPTATPVVVEPLASSTYDVAEMEEFRQALLDIADILDELYPYAEAAAELSGEPLPPRVNRELIKELSPDGLYLIREAFGGEEEYETFLNNIATLKSLVFGSDQSLAGSEKATESLAVAPALNAAAQSPPSSINIIPAPTPVTTPPPGIRHDGNHIEQVNKRLGDLPDPKYFAVCPQERYPNPAVLAVLLRSFMTDAADELADILSCQGTFVMVCTPFGGGTNLPGCLGWGIAKGINLATQAVLEGLNFCIATIDAAELEAARKNTRIIHAELGMHDENLRRRFNTTDKFLFHFRNVNLRSRIEANLASDEDDPISLFQLPRQFCISPELETLTDPTSSDYDPFAPEALAGCGLLEVVRDTVRSAIDMTKTSTQDIGNAEAEFDAAVKHYDNEEWKLAYDRFRKAYRAAVGP